LQVELAPSLGIQCILDAGDETYGSVEEALSGMFVVDAGVVVDGNRINLFDLAEAALASPSFSIHPDSDDDDDARLLVPCGPAAVALIPHAKVREIIGPFFELLVAQQDG